MFYLIALTDRLQEEMSEKVIAQKRVNALKKTSDLKLEQELSVKKLGESHQKLNSLSPNNIKRKICRREKNLLN